MLHRAAVLILATLTLEAQTLHFGDRISLTNTRYATGTVALLTTPQDQLRFWLTPHNVRVNDAATDDLALPLLDADDADVVLIEDRHLITAAWRGEIRGLFVDANGAAHGQAFPIATGTRPRAAFDGEQVTLLFRDSSGDVRRLLLSRDGVPASEAMTVAASTTAFDVAVAPEGAAVVIAAADGVKLRRLDRNGAMTAELPLGPPATDVAVASRGGDLLVAWSGDGGLEVTTIGSDGAAATSAALTFERARSLSASAAGEGWRVSWMEDETARAARLVGSETVIETPRMQGAAEQSLAAAASNATATLVVWNESGGAYAGLRTESGWRELQLTQNEPAVAAAADGTGFAVLTRSTSESHIWLLDGAGQQVTSAALPFRANAVAAGAGAFAVVGTDSDDNVVASRVGFDGTTSPGQTLGSGSDPRVASDGSAYLAVWETPLTSIEAVRLDADVRPIEAAPILVYDGGAADPAVAFDGERYVVAFEYGSYVRARRLSREGLALMELMQTGRAGGAVVDHVALTSLGENLALTWEDGRAQLLVLRGLQVLRSQPFDSRAGSGAAIAPAAGGRFAVLQSDVTDVAPHYGATRVLMTAADHVTLARPLAPTLSASTVNGNVRLDWTPAADSVGYRLEYRIDGSAWRETEAWHEQATATFIPERSGVHEFRVRTFNQSGHSEYSAAVEMKVTKGRRRAVR